MKKLSLILTIITLGLSQVFSIDWNQYHGRRSDNKTDELITSAAWLEKNSAQKWKADTPLGFSSFSCEGSKAFTLIAEEDEDGLMREICIALDTRTGKRLWSTWLCRMDYKSGGGNSGAPNNSGGDGPRSTPSVFNGKVWVYDSDMILYCINAENGKILWDVNVIKEHAGINIKWNHIFTGSVLLSCSSTPLNIIGLQSGSGIAGDSFLAIDSNNEGFILTVPSTVPGFKLASGIIDPSSLSSIAIDDFDAACMQVFPDVSTFSVLLVDKKTKFKCPIE